MVEGELVGRECLAAILASVVVAGVNIGAGERYVVETPLDFDISQQADNRRQLETDRNRPDLPVVHGDDLNLALAPERNRLLPVDNLEGLIRRVQQKRLF